MQAKTRLNYKDKTKEPKRPKKPKEPNKKKNTGKQTQTNFYSPTFWNSAPHLVVC